MCTLRMLFKSTVHRGYEPHRELLVVKFAQSSDRTIAPFSLRYVDGWSKGLACQAVVAIIDVLDAF